MTDVAIHHDPKPGEHGWTQTGVSNEKLGMWVFLGSECLLFGGLISTYMLYKNTSLHGPAAARPLRHPVHVGVVVRAADELDDDGAGAVGHPTRRSPAVPGVARHHGVARSHVHLGSGVRVHLLREARDGLHDQHGGFGVLHAHRIPRCAREPRHRDAHVAVHDVVARPAPAGAPEVVEIVGLYWHFVDVVWILIFTVVYLIP